MTMWAMKFTIMPIFRSNEGMRMKFMINGMEYAMMKNKSETTNISYE